MHDSYNLTHRRQECRFFFNSFVIYLKHDLTIAFILRMDGKSALGSKDVCDDANVALHIFHIMSRHLQDLPRMFGECCRGCERVSRLGQSPAAFQFCWNPKSAPQKLEVHYQAQFSSTAANMPHTILHKHTQILYKCTVLYIYSNILWFINISSCTIRFRSSTLFDIIIFCEALLGFRPLPEQTLKQ